MNELSGDKYNYVQDIFQASVLNATEKERLKALNLAGDETFDHTAITFTWPNLGSTSVNFREENRNYLDGETGVSHTKPFSFLSHKNM